MEKNSEPWAHVAVMEAGSAAADHAVKNWSLSGDAVDANHRPTGILCRALLRGILCELTARPAKTWHLSNTSNGKPILSGAGGMDLPGISLSHSGSWSACVVSFLGDVGIDIECRRPGRDFSGIAESAFGPMEREEVSRLGSERFYSIWVLREAISKATGNGLQQAVDQTDRVASGPINGIQTAELDGWAWILTHCSPRPNLDLAIALRLKGAAYTTTCPSLRWWFTENRFKSPRLLG
jgi:phosphopantetheinyl transferase